ncbi:MAG: phosphosulfolactate synthase [Planctomycetota bacterium]|jgi:phosphosulfolactate synthase|nr:phosphosulfolactate synthase [Planctomycetota bacterium]MDP7132409.1 phosphosulfolactate synthase [Planctomycetota bacterium]MDP7248352.1 phosphosulfolactate synthase [Planctomycetota bacterium]
MASHFFEGLDGTERASKPRQTGLTMVIDWGFGPNAQSDLITACASHFDFAKVAVGISRLLSNETLSAKLGHYQEHEIEPFPGGQFLEWAEVEGKAELYFDAVQAAGYRCIEVSDNMDAVTLEWKEKMILKGAGLGLRIIGEVGKKEGLPSGTDLSDDAVRCLEAGAEIVLLEAAELVDDDEETVRMIERAVERVGIGKVMFELPGPWIDGVRACDIHRMRRELIDRYGPEVNLGNVAPDDLMTLEAYRRGLGVNAGKK